MQAICKNTKELRAKCEIFFQQYPEIKRTMLLYVNPMKSTRKQYCKWLDYKSKHESTLGGDPVHHDAPTFGTATFYRYNFGEGSQFFGFGNLFEYLTAQ